MKNTVSGFAAAAAALSLSAGASMAADVATSAGYDWTGLYLGAHGGYVWGEADVGYEGDGGGGDLDGFLGGALAGYNFQTDMIVLGVEGDVGGGDVNGNGAVGAPPPQPASYYTYDLDWNAHLRARAGVAVDKALFFVAGGLAVARHTLSAEENNQSHGDDSQTHTGWTIGAGVEYGLTDNLLLRAEYLYDDYGSQTYSDDEGDEYDVDLTAQTARAALSYKF